MGRSASSGLILDQRNDILRWIPYTRLTSLFCEAGRSIGGKTFARARAQIARAQVEYSQGLGFGALGFRPVRSRLVEHLFSTHAWGGGQKSGIFRRGPRGYRARISAKFRKLFFTCVQCGLGNRAGESATNFAGPSCRQIATRGAAARANARASCSKLNLTPLHLYT